MDPNLTPPAPPPLQPVAPSSNPYEFITQAPSGKNSRYAGSGSKKMRILVVVTGLFVLAIVAAIVIAVLSGGSKSPASDYQSLLEQQTELIRISALGMTKAQQTEAKNIAITTNLSLTSQQAGLISLAKKAGANTDPKVLSLGKDSQTDAKLTTAAQTNQFDTVFIQIITTNLKKYQQTLKKIYDETTTKTAKDNLSKYYTNANVLITNQ